MTEFKIIIIKDTAPSINRAYYFVKCGSKRVIKVKSQIAKEWFKKVQDTFKEKYPEASVSENKISVKLIFYFPDKRRHDVDNFQKLTLDALTGLAWKDDSQIQMITSMKYESQPERSTYIEIKELK